MIDEINRLKMRKYNLKKKRSKTKINLLLMNKGLETEKY